MQKENKKELIETAEKEAFRLQCRDDVCSRSALAGLAKVFDFIPEELVTASASLCGGTGSGSGSCGAYCAGLLAVGLKYNASIAQEQEDPEKRGEVFGTTTAAKMNEFRVRFTKEVGSILCPAIHKKYHGKVYHLDREEDLQAFFALPGHEEKCASVAAAAARIAAEMILEEEE